jgi:hypothetical protein
VWDVKWEARWDGCAVVGKSKQVPLVCLAWPCAGMFSLLVRTAAEAEKKGEAINGRD